MLSAITWDVDPVIIDIFGRGIRWYGLLFALGLLILGPMIEDASGSVSACPRSG